MKKQYIFAVVALFVFCIALVFLTHFSSATILATEGYFISSDKIDDVLLSETKTAKASSVKLEKVTYEDSFYTNMNNLYVGEEKKTYVNKVYPIFSNNGKAIVNLDVKAKLINNEFEFFESYENFTLTDGKLYNYGDLEQADYEEYLFLQLSNMTYINLFEIKIQTLTQEYTIPLNSVINFQEDYLKYYYFDSNGKLLYNIIDGIDLGNNIVMGDNNFTYKHLLIKIDKIVENEMSGSTDESGEEGNGEGGTGTGNGTGTGSNKPVKYVKPSVSVSQFTANVYSAKAKLTINDPAGVIAGGVSFQFKIGDRIFSRKTFITSGELEVIGLVPNTEFTIIGSYKYYNEEKKKIEATFFEQKIKTLGIEKLEPIEMAFENGPVYSNKLEVNRLRFTSDLKSETLKGANKLSIYINGELYSVSSAVLHEMMAGKEKQYISPAKLDSNIKLEYEFQIVDAFGNKIKTNNVKGVSRTSNEIPTASIKVVKSEVNTTRVGVTLKNKDKVYIDNYKYIIYDNNMAIVDEEELNNSQEYQEITLRSLDPNTTYLVRVVGDFDIEDGNGVSKNNVIGEGKFTTLPLSSLGYIRIIADAVDLTNVEATVKAKIDVETVSPILLELLNSIELRVIDGSDNVVYSHLYKDAEINSIRAGQEFVDKITGLSSMTEYKVEFYSYVVQGSVKEDISVICPLKKFKTLKRQASVNIINKFVNGNMIDFDVKVVDVDGAIESGRVLLEVRDSTEKLIAMESLVVNGAYQRHVYEKLSADQKYSFSYKVESYNIGYDNSTFEGDYLLFKDDIVTEQGIKGSLELISLLRQINSRNLFNIEDYNRIRKEGNTGYKQYDIKNNTVMFGSKNGYTNFSYFLPEGFGKPVTVSFYAKYDSGTPNKAPVYIGKNYGQNLDYKLNDLGDEWKKYEFTFRMTTNYIGFVINETANVNMTTKVLFKDIQILSLDLADVAAKDVTMSYHSSGYKFSNAKMFGGESSMPDWRSNDYIIGNYGDGHARITSVTTGKVTDFSYTGSSQTFEVPENGLYLFEAWGAQGGTRNTYIGGKGGYTSGQINLKKGTKIYIYVGGQGGSKSSVTNVGGWNGGGYSGNNGGAQSYGGGGATDFRLVGGTWNNSESLKSRIMVAAGGGGASSGSTTAGGAAGGLVGYRGTSSHSTYNEAIYNNTGGTQTFTGVSYQNARGGYFGYAIQSFTGGWGGGGGGGYYGGTNGHGTTGAGGSSYISGYLGCVSYSKAQSASEEDSTEYIPYSEKKQYLGTVQLSLYDLRNEISTDDYYVRIFLKGQLVDSIRYDLLNNAAEGIENKYEFVKNKSYEVRLSVKIRDRFYDINSIEFVTNSEIRSIRTVDEFYEMHTNGKYVVLNDLDFTRVNRYYTSYFYGDLDFKGHKMIWNVQGRASYLFHTLGAGGKLSNIVVDATYDNTSNRNWFYGVVYQNFGTIDNIMINILDVAANVPNYANIPGVYVNYGLIQNFVIHTVKSPTAQAVMGLLVWSNQGIIRNGYVYGENIKAYSESPDRRKDVAVIAGETTTNSRIENVFSLITVEKNSTLATEASVGNLIGYSATGILQNVYSVEDPDKENTNVLNKDPNIGTISGINARNVYYASDKIYSASNMRSLKMSKLALYDVEFQNSVLNSYNAFEVDSFVSLGYYPQVKMNDCMPNQEWIPLPKVNDSDTVDVTSCEEVSNDGDSAEIILNINNPGAEVIEGVIIKDIGRAEVISQENEWGKTKLHVKVSDPIKYKSQYSVMQLNVDRFGIKYQVTYLDKERPINLDLYYPINSLKDWKTLVATPTQNYFLKTDLDFRDVTISNYVVGTFSGKLNGNGHTIKNITIASNNAMINYLTGTIKNLYIENYKKTNNTSYGGFIYQVGGNCVIDNVHMKNVEISAYSFIGGMVGYGSGLTLRNSSVTNFKNVTTPDREDIRIGGLAGYLSGSLIQNCYVQDLNIDIMDSISTYGIGGIIGEMGSGTIENVYATGMIKSNSSNVGGIVGKGNIRLTGAWSNVNIMTELDFVGGIIGNRASGNISNTLVLGAVYSNYSGLNIHRTSGNTLTVPQSNFAWENQPFYGFVTGESSAEVLLTLEQLMDVNIYYDLIGFTDQFDYSGLDKGILPKLNNCDTGELLPGQKDSVPIDEDFDILDVQVEPTVTDATIRLEIDNPNAVDIVGVTFDYLDIIKSKVGFIDGVTIVELTVEPKRYYDNYTLTGILYSNGSGPDETYNKIVRIPVQFYRTLSKFEDWQQISKSTTENYRLTADIDFSGKANINTGVSIGRLEGQDDGYSLKNYTATVGVNKPFIRKITTSLKNVTFSNFNITSNASGNFVNIIKTSYADMDNVKFKNVTINAPKASYVAPIGYNRAIDIKNIGIYSNNIKGVSYVGGLCSYSFNYDTTYITADACIVYGSGGYVGGVFGYKEYSNPPTNFYYTATNMNVTGKTDVGGIFGYGGANNSSISNSTIIGLAGGNYIGSFSGRAGQYYTRVITVSDCEVISHGSNYVGGVYGWAYDVDNVYAYRTNVTQEDANKSYVGGAIGYKNGYTHQRLGVFDCVITNAGNNTGGLVGGALGTGTLYYTYVYNTEVNGVKNVGGAVGYSTNSRLYYNITNAHVIGSGDYVGGIYGYISQIDPSNSSYSTVAGDVLLANSEIIGRNFVGAFAGYTPAQLTYNYFYRIALVGNVTAISSNPTVGIVSGLDKNFMTAIPRVYVYNKNKINSKFVSDVYADYASVEASALINASTLATTKFYTDRGFSTSYWNLSNVPSGYFAKSKQITVEQPDISLPVDVVSFSLRTRPVLTGHILPQAKVYSSGVNTINIDFDKVDQMSYFEVYENDKKVADSNINSRTYTLGYGYQTKLKLVVSDGFNKRVYNYNSEDLVNKVSTVDSKYAYIYDGKLLGNIKKVNNKFIHIYKDKALTDDYQIYDIVSGSFTGKVSAYNVSLYDSVVPLYEFTYDDSEIETYATYSLAHTKTGDVELDKQIFVKNGVMELVDNALDNNKNTVIIDEYAKNNYVTVLGDDGVIYNLKKRISIPGNFVNKGISYMSNNINSKTSIVVVMYKTGKVVVFDYRTGKIVTEGKATENISIFDYFKNSLSTSKSLVSDDIDTSYKDSLNLMELLEKKPLIKNNNGTYDYQASDSSQSGAGTRYNDYVTYYNAITNKYDVLNIATLKEDSKDDVVVSENNKIYSSYDLVDYYMNESVFEKVFKNVNFIVIFVAIVIGIVLALVLWLRNNKLLNVREDR